MDNPLASYVFISETHTWVWPGTFGAIFPWNAGNLASIHTDLVPPGAPPTSSFNATATNATVTFYEQAQAPSPGLVVPGTLVTKSVLILSTVASLGSAVVLPGAGGQSVRIWGYSIDLQEDFATTLRDIFLWDGTSTYVWVGAQNCGNSWQLDLSQPVVLPVGKPLNITNNDTVTHNLGGYVRYLQY